MSKLDELITKYCPNGVEYKELRTYCEIYDGTHQTPKYTDNGVKFASVENILNPFLTNKYISEKDYQKYKIKIQENDLLMTRIGSIGTCFVIEKKEPLAYYVSLALLRPNNKIVNSRFLKYSIESIQGRRELRKRTLVNAVPIKINMGDIGKIVLPVPPISVQEEIVRILDKYTELTSELISKLTTELTARRTQYRYYLNLLYNNLPSSINTKLGDFATIHRGGNFQKRHFVPVGKPCIHYGQIYTHFGSYSNQVITYLSDDDYKNSKKAKKNDIIMAVTSENVQDVCSCIAWMGDEDVAVSGHTAIIHHSQNARFLSYFFQTELFGRQKLKLAHGTKVIEVTPDKLVNIVVPIPLEKKQAQIVSILDRLDSICNDLTNGLATEIEMRQKQYEYYRDKLLTFKPLKEKESV